MHKSSNKEDKIKEQICSWDELKINENLEIKLVYDTSVRKEIAILMPTNSKLPNHSAPGKIVVQVLSFV